MPSEGFYVLTKYRPHFSIIYTTGIAGKGGHKYWRNTLKSFPESLNDFYTLLWSCVPGEKSIKDYQFASTFEEAVKLLKRSKSIGKN